MNAEHLKRATGADLLITSCPKCMIHLTCAMRDPLRAGSLAMEIRDLVASEYGGYWYTEIIHGSGSPEAEKLQMYREHDLEYCVGLARHALLGRAAVGEAPTVRVS